MSETNSVAKPNRKVKPGNRSFIARKPSLKTELRRTVVIKLNPFEEEEETKV